MWSPMTCILKFSQYTVHIIAPQQLCCEFVKDVSKDVRSSPAELISNVPQGSVLGPLLFSLYVAPIEDIITAHGLQSMIFADDMQMYLVM